MFALKWVELYNHIGFNKPVSERQILHVFSYEEFRFFVCLFLRHESRKGTIWEEEMNQGKRAVKARERNVRM